MNIHFADVNLWVEYVPASAHFYRDAVGLNIIPSHAGDGPHFELDGCFFEKCPPPPRPPD